MRIETRASASSDEICIKRQCYRQATFDEKYGARPVDFSLVGSISKKIRSTIDNRYEVLKSSGRTCLPPFQWIPEYNLKTDLLRDVIGGLTVGVMNIPQGMAYGILAGLPPVYGLYTSFFPPIIYALFGTSRHISVGTFAITSLMVAAAISGVSSGTKMPINGTEISNSTSSSVLSWFCGAGSSETGSGVDQMKVDAAVAMGFLVGIFQLAFGLLHMGFISSYLSDQLVEGLTTGAAILVFTSQVAQCFGISMSEASGVLGIVKFYGCLFTRLVHTNFATLITSVICIIALVIVKEFIEPPFKKRFKFPIPVELFIIIISTLISYLVNLNAHYTVKIVGPIPTGLGAPRLPSFELMADLVPSAVATSIVVFSMAVSMGKLFGKKHDYEIDPNQEWFALGIVHVVGSFFQCHAGGASLSRSSVQEQQGNKSQLCGIVAACLILVVLLALGPLFRDLPTCALAAIIIVNLKGMLIQFKKLPPLFERSKTDFMIWIVTFTAVVLLDISFGLVVGVLFALATVIIRSQWPNSACLGQMPYTELYKGTDGYAKALELNGVKIYRFDSHLYFANADLFREELNRRTGVNMAKEKAKRRSKKTVKQNITTTQSEANLSRYSANTVDVLRAIIIDCSSFPYVDMMGLDALRQIYEDYAFLGIQVAFAGVKVSVRQMMKTSKFFDAVPQTALFPSVHDAVYALSVSPGSTPEMSRIEISELEMERF